MNDKIALTWELARGANRKEDVSFLTVPADDSYFQSQVPGAVQLDYAAEFNGPDLHYGVNYKYYQGMEDYNWFYRTRIPGQSFISLKPGEGLFFVSLGIDYSYEVYLDSPHSSENLIFRGEGMFSPLHIDISRFMKKGKDRWLYIRILPAPKRPNAPRGRQQADQSVKPAVSYGWDWHPELIPLGIWDETYLEIKPVEYYENFKVNYTLSSDLNSARVSLAGLGREPGDFTFTLYDRESHDLGQIKEAGQTLQVENLNLWWPHDQGNPYLYHWSCHFLGPGGQIYEKKGTLGFRKTRLIMHEGAWDEPSDFPKSRSNPPITIEINDRPIFCKGSNWVNPEIFPGIITAETYETLVKLGKKANFNMFRVWGGGIVNKESFFDICDREGIMVWQEFPLACNNYEDDPDYLNVLEQEADSIIQRLKPHPSVVLWCGGNELFNSWSGMTEQSQALRLLNARTLAQDPHTPFIMTSPLMGMAHGYYLFRYADGRDVLSHMNEANFTAYTEFGCAGPSLVSTLKSIIPPQELWPPRAGTSWEDHHAFNAWPGGGSDTWLSWDTIEYYFGSCENLEQLVERGQFLQTVGYKGIYEEARRQKPRCSMALNWCWNEPWPTAGNNSLINYPAQPKPAYYGVGESCRPVLYSARIDKFSWTGGECLSWELWLLNDGPERVEQDRVNCFLETDGRKILLLTWDCPGTEGNKNLIGPRINYPLSGLKEKQIMTIILEPVNKPEFKSTYGLLYSPLEKKDDEGAPVLNI